jgi:cytochrome c556
MYRNLTFVLAIVIAGAVASACGTANDKTAPYNEAADDQSSEVSSIAPSSIAPSDLPLVEIMQGLETDLAIVAHGIWTQDQVVIREAATRIAEHPKVTAEQLATIKNALGSEIAMFVQHDQVVHGAAVELVAAVDSSRGNEDLFMIYRKMEQGCMSCHGAFQNRVSEALAKSGS